MDNNVDSMIGRGWAAHREGRNGDAIADFEKVLRTDANNVDAHYGLGLAHRANGSLEQARVALEKSLEVCRKNLSELRGERKENNLSTYEDDRYMMLIRMISQRLDELKARS
ncbi:MAG: tetratricopeptide repeat protein [Anaerolineae bacterium]|jgi:tetratricopeptide (TPR) repeat protein|nr:tetratricopeptide repeat protein [Anaerolineae bacterium]